MASRNGYKLLQDIESSYGSISNTDSSAKSTVDGENDDRGFIASCPAALEPSKAKLHSSHEETGIFENSVRAHFNLSWPQPSKQMSIRSNEETNNREDELQSIGELEVGNELLKDEPQVNCCISCMASYNNYTRMIRNSRLIYIFHLFVGALSISAIVTGIIFFQSCEGTSSYAVPILNILMGISGLLLLNKWVAKVCRQRRSLHFWNFERDRLVWYIGALLFLMFVEFAFSCQVLPITLQSKKEEIKCVKTYYDYLYYLHITNAVSLLLAALLYLPDCYSYISDWHESVPSHSNGHFEPL